MDDETLRPLFRHVTCLVWMVDRDLRVLHAVGARRTWDGLPPGPIEGKRIPELLGTDDPDDAFLRALDRAAVGESQSFRYDFADHTYEVHIEPSAEGFAVVALDITDRKVAEELLARSEARLKEAQRVAHVGSWEWEIAADRVQWTDELYRIYGLQKSEFDGTYDGFLSRIPVAERDAAHRFLYNVFCEGKPFAFEHRIVRPDGAIRRLRTQGDVTTDGTGKVVRMSGACWDVTELWEASRTVEQTISVLRATLESTADGLLVIGNDGKVTAFNQRLCDLWHIPPAMVAGQSFQALLEFVHPQLVNADACMANVQAMAARPDGECLDTLVFHDGRYFERYSRPQRLPDPSGAGRIVGRVWSYRDVTERERLLRRSVFLADASRLLADLDVEKVLDAVARLSLPWLGDAVAVDVRQGRVVSLPEGAGEIPPGTEPPAAVSPPEAGQPVEWVAGGRAFLAVALVARGETIGALTFARGADHLYTEPDMIVAGALAVRVTLALENGRLYREARDALAARDEFLSVAAHELRGPATSLNVAVKVLEEAKDQATAERMRELIPRGVKRIAAFLDEILDVTRIRSGGLELTFAPVDLVAVVREVAAAREDDRAASGSPLSLELPAKAVGTWDRARLAQVAGVLLDNAIKFGAGKPIEVSVAAVGGVATLAVADHGIGIAPADQARLFRPYERAVSYRHYGGLGMGLFIARSIVDALGGTLEVRSEEGAGATFTVRLPLARAQ